MRPNWAGLKARHARARGEAPGNCPQSATSPAGATPNVTRALPERFRRITIPFNAETQRGGAATHADHRDAMNTEKGVGELRGSRRFKATTDGKGRGNSQNHGAQNHGGIDDSVGHDFVKGTPKDWGRPKMAGLAALAAPKLWFRSGFIASRWSNFIRRGTLLRVRRSCEIALQIEQRNTENCFSQLRSPVGAPCDCRLGVTLRALRRCVEWDWFATTCIAPAHRPAPSGRRIFSAFYPGRRVPNACPGLSHHGLSAHKRGHRSEQQAPDHRASSIQHRPLSPCK